MYKASDIVSLELDCTGAAQHLVEIYHIDGSSIGLPCSKNEDVARATVDSLRRYIESWCEDAYKRGVLDGNAQANDPGVEVSWTVTGSGEAAGTLQAILQGIETYTIRLNGQDVNFVKLLYGYDHGPHLCVRDHRIDDDLTEWVSTHERQIPIAEVDTVHIY